MKKFGVFLALGLLLQAAPRAQDHSEDKSLKSVLEGLKASPSGFEAFQYVQEFGESCRSLKAGVTCVQSAIKGLFSDGLMGDVDTFKFAAKEGARLALSTSTGGQFVLKLLNKKTTGDKIREQVEKLGPSALEALPVIAKIATNPTYQYETATKIYGILGAFVRRAADKGLQLKCSELQDSLCRILGQVGYEALASLAMAAVTIEAGGAGGFAKIALLLPKLAKQYPKLEPLIAALYKLADGLKDATKLARGAHAETQLAKEASEAPGARFARGRARVLHHSRFVDSDSEALRRAKLSPADRLAEVEELLGHSLGGDKEEIAQKLEKIHQIGGRPGEKSGGYFRDPTSGELRSTLSPEQIKEKKKRAAELGLRPEETERLLDGGYLGNFEAAPTGEATYASVLQANSQALGGIPTDYKVPAQLQNVIESYRQKSLLYQKEIDEAPAKIKKLRDEEDDIYYEMNSGNRLKQIEAEIKRLENPINLLIKRGGSEARDFDQALKGSVELSSHVKKVEEEVLTASNLEMKAQGYEVPKEILNSPSRAIGSATAQGGSSMGIVYRKKLADGRIETVQKIYDRVSGESLGRERFIVDPKTGALEFPDRAHAPSHGGQISCQFCHGENLFFDPSTRQTVNPNNRSLAAGLQKL